ncbi:DUF2187 family protein [Robertmurraya sp. FSL R5-0851]|uniref:DUF2187 family protein n=1 Tax=Robertmurraya sp. FSL R5-0851 TaxID=2921584 RepID=UPI0030F8D38F
MNTNTKAGDKITFSRNGMIFEGTIVVVNENTVIVEITEDDQKLLLLPNNRTVVSHSNYKNLSSK